MKNTLRLALAGLVLGSSTHVFAECTAPTTPTLPDGATASLETMLEGQAAVKAYQASNTEFRACLEPLIVTAEANAAGEEPTEEAMAALKALNEQYNASVSSEEEVASQFNAALKAYKAANPG